MKKNVVYFAGMMFTLGLISCSEDMTSEIDETLKDSSVVVSGKSLINESTNPEILLGKWYLTKCFYGNVDHIKDTTTAIFPVKIFDFMVDNSFKTGSTVNCVMCGGSKDSFFPKWNYNIVSMGLYFYSNALDIYPYNYGYFNTANCVVAKDTMTLVRKQLNLKQKTLVEYTMVYVKKTDY